jgi:hypothetical protein
LELSRFRPVVSRESLLLRAIVRTRFQFVVFAGVAVEENDLLRGLVLGLRHSVSPLAIFRFN